MRAMRANIRMFALMRGVTRIFALMRVVTRIFALMRGVTRMFALIPLLMAQGRNAALALLSELGGRGGKGPGAP